MTEDVSGAIHTVGVQSVVREDGVRVGHVHFFDCDDGYSYRSFVRAMDHFGGFTAILESSPGSFHAWNLSVSEASDVALRKLSTVVDDHQHTAIGYRRACDSDWPAGGWTLRLGKKMRPEAEGGETYKDKPMLLETWYNETHLPQSKPHLELLGKLYDVKTEGRAGNVLIGETLYTMSYQTIDDETKEEWR